MNALRRMLGRHDHAWTEWRWWGPTSLIAERRCVICDKSQSRRF